MNRNNLIAYILSVVAICTYVSHFWHPGIAGYVLWGIAAACAIACIYCSLALRGKTEEVTNDMGNPG